MASGKTTPVKQDDSIATYAAKIENKDCILNFLQSAEELHNRIRGLSPIPLAQTMLRGKSIKIIESVITGETTGDYAGTVLSVSGGIIHVACGKGVLGIKTLLPEGKRRMSASDFINGRGVVPGDVFGVKNER